MVNADRCENWRSHWDDLHWVSALNRMSHKAIGMNAVMRVLGPARNVLYKSKLLDAEIGPGEYKIIAKDECWHGMLQHSISHVERAAATTKRR